MPRGRPKGTGSGRKVTHIRVDEDIAVMLGEICRQTGEVSADITGPLLRGPLIKRFLELLPGLERMAKTSEEVRERLKTLAPVILAAKRHSA